MTQTPAEVSESKTAELSFEAFYYTTDEGTLRLTSDGPFGSIVGKDDEFIHDILNTVSNSFWEKRYFKFLSIKDGVLLYRLTDEPEVSCFKCTKVVVTQEQHSQQVHLVFSANMKSSLVRKNLDEASYN